MKIKISNLQDETYNFKFEDDIKALEISEPFFGKFQTEVLLTKFRDQFILEVKTNIKAKFVCDRCADEFETNIENKYKMVYMTDPGTKQSDSDNVTFISPELDVIDITSDVRDYSLLSIPMKKLCKEDCKGLCFKCGKNLNQGECNCEKEEIDDRWKPLLEVKKKLN
jgi:uncharacterized protein